jgi:hypothetical protein
LHLQLKGNIIKRFCQKISNKVEKNSLKIFTLKLITKINSFYIKKKQKIFIHYLKINKKHKGFYKKLLKIIYYKIISNICFNLNTIYKEIQKRERKNELLEQTFNIQNSYYLKKKMIITSTQQIEEKNAEFEYRKKKFYQNLTRKNDNKEEMKQSKRKFYWRPFHNQKSLNEAISSTEHIEKNIMKNIESNYMTKQEKKEEINIQKETISYEKEEEIEYFEKEKKFYWLPYHSIESSKEINKLKNLKHSKFESNDS